MNTWHDTLDEHLHVVREAQAALDAPFRQCVERCRVSLEGGGKILVCGNGGSAADAQHFAAELSGRFFRDRPALAALALTTDTSALTAIANDLGYDEVFARQVEALGRSGDVLIALSTSGNSQNVLRAVDRAREQGLTVIGLSGRVGGALLDRSDLCLRAPSDSVPRIQEVHELVLHGLAEALENALFPEPGA